MRLQYGKHAGKSAELVVLKFPDWVEYYLREHGSSKVGQILASLIRAFDEKKFVTECYQCKSEATRSSLYAGNAEDAMYWCDDCDPYSLAATPGKLVLANKYHEAVRFVSYRCNNTAGEKRDVIRKLAQAKGLPSRLGEKAAANFFA